jgi:hypothetical protein
MLDGIFVGLPNTLNALNRPKHSPYPRLNRGFLKGFPFNAAQWPNIISIGLSSVRS